MASAKRKSKKTANVMVKTSQSSWVESFGYDSESATLFLKTQKGDAYKYANVSADVFERFKAMDSAGQAYNQLIKGTYQEEKIEVSEYEAVMGSATPTRSNLGKRSKKRLLWRTSGIIGWQIVPAF